MFIRIFCSPTGELPIEELLSMYGYVVPEEDSSTDDESPDEGQQLVVTLIAIFPFWFKLCGNCNVETCVCTYL